MQALILAAGMGKRLKNLTQNNTKCMVSVNGTSLIERMLRQLDMLALNRIIIVIGYKGKELKEHIASLNVSTQIVYIENSIYDKTNNIYSLSLAKHYLQEDDTILLESDLIFEDSILQLLLDDPRETLALVDKYESWMDGTCIKIGSDDSIESFIPGKKFKFEDIPEYYKTVNIYKFSQHFSATHYVPFLDAYSLALGNNEYYEQVLRVITMLDEPEIKAKRLSGQLWYEIDDIQDLDIASSMFIDSNSDKLRMVQKRWGGYWRYPRLLDFCYPRNPYFPPQRLVNEIKANIEKLISEYPSGMAVNTLLAAKNLGIDTSNIIVSNGIEEIIQSIMSSIKGTVGYIKPTNEEIINRCRHNQLECFLPDNRDLSYTFQDIITYFDSKKIEILMLINPEYHTGNYISHNNIIEILKWGKNKGIKIIVDESYCDFADELHNSLMDYVISENLQNVIILKNISVTHGVSGLRLGCAVSANIDWLEKLKNSLSIWNINSFAEFYLQIEEKYQKDYILSLEQFKTAKTRCIQKMSEISEIRVIPSQTNYCLCELTGDLTSQELAEQLLVKHNILIKDMTDRIHNGHQYIKIAIRNEEDNQKLIDALATIFCHNNQNNEGRIANKLIKINEKTTRAFFETRTKKILPHRYNYVIYQDSNPELALERDSYEKEKIGPLLNINGQSMVLDIGCGVGRWGDEIIPQLTTGKYIGIDYSEDFINIAKETLESSGKSSFYKGSFQETENILKNNGYSTFDTILINGVLMYINDDEIENCLRSVCKLAHKGTRIYIKESVGADTRFTLNNFYSEELGSQYNAIYRSLNEYNRLFNDIYITNGYRIIISEATWKHEQENRKETLSWYWIIEN